MNNIIDIINNKLLTNLLINSDLRNPINQRGKTVYNTIGYSIDRWALKNANTTLTVNEGYCTLTGDNKVLVQNIEFPTLYSNKEVTLSARVKGNGGRINLVLYSAELSRTLASKTTDSTNWQEISVSCTIGNLINNSKALSVSIEGTGANSINIEWVKLEEGSVATPFIPRSFGEESLLCQSYLQSDNVFISNSEPDKDGIWVNTSESTFDSDGKNIIAEQIKKYMNNKIGDLSGLNTDTKDNLVNAINEKDNLVNTINENVTQLSENMKKRLEEKAPYGVRKPIITIVDDDGRGEVLTRLKPVLDKHKFPATLGIISSWNLISDKDLKELENNGWEIASHTVNHLSLSTLSLEQAEYEAKESREQLIKRGFNVTTMVYPFGGHNLEIRKFIRKYYECAVQVSGTKPYNEIPCQQYNLRRIAVGSYFEKPEQNTYEWYKAQVDSAIANNGWIILMTHVGATEHTAEQQAIFEQLIDYIATLNVDVLTVREAMKFYGNTVFTGDYTGNPNTDIYSVITNTGEKYENNFRTIPKRNIKNDTPLSAFPSGVSYVDFLFNDNAGFPPNNNAGTLITYKCATLAEQSNFQEFHLYNSPRMFKRVWTGTSWGSWAEIGLNIKSNIIVSGINAFTSSSLPSDFTNGTITYTEVNSSNSTGFPNNASGILITYKISSDVNYCYQEYKFRNSEKRYIRSYVGAAWSSWRLVQSGVASTTQNITATINAGETYVHDFTFTGVKQYDVIHISPVVFEQSLYGLVITGVIKGNDNASIVLTNLSSKTINLNSKAFACGVITN